MKKGIESAAGKVRYKVTN